MSHENIQRLKNDLTTIRQVMRLDKPYDAADIPALMMFGVGGMVAIPLLLFTTWNQQLTFILTLIPGLIVYARRYLTAKRNKVERPALWKEYRVSLVAVIFAMPLTAVWVWWSQSQFGTTREAAGAAVLFCVGAFVAGVGALDSNRRSYLPGGVCLILFALAFAWLTPRQIAPAGAAVLACAMFSTAAFIWWQTRDHVRRNSGNESLT